MSVRSQNLLDSTPDKCVNAQFIVLDDMAFDGSGLQVFTFDSSIITFNPPEQIRTIYFENETNGQIVLTLQNGQRITLDSGKAGYLPVFMQLPSLLSFADAPAGTAIGTIRFGFYNFRIAPILWDTF